MRSSRVVRATDSQCQNRNSPGLDPSILRYSEKIPLLELQTDGRWLADLENIHRLGTSLAADRHAATLGNFGHRATVDSRLLEKYWKFGGCRMTYFWKLPWLLTSDRLMTLGIFVDCRLSVTGRFLLLQTYRMVRLGNLGTAAIVICIKSLR